ncbi:PIN domain-containing protein [Kovacikia minuta CCNUW1]|uniref:type II toxin-antitoxin system VapC family toxin n=1 Tax=Kovacikia minuta TaxID=2931930 RepID=UPI001CCE2EA0|nr:PIN domain-containing protein [Kovacikia minuta]UBF28145.1 PIN domain-containing protein [Kovacikia minuta CCNUW1]
MSSNLFADTSGWSCLLVEAEPQHAQAIQCFARARQQGQSIITTNYIIAELVALLHRPLRVPRSKLFQIVDTIKAAPYVQIIHLDETTDATAWELCKNRSDKAWSLVDCTSFVLMQQLGLQEALTTDQHFEQAGFLRLLKP